MRGRQGKPGIWSDDVVSPSCAAPWEIPSLKLWCGRRLAGRTMQYTRAPKRRTGPSPGRDTMGGLTCASASASAYVLQARGMQRGRARALHPASAAAPPKAACLLSELTQFPARPSIATTTQQHSFPPALFAARLALSLGHRFIRTLLPDITLTPIPPH